MDIINELNAPAIKTEETVKELLKRFSGQGTSHQVKIKYLRHSLRLNWNRLMTEIKSRFKKPNPDNLCHYFK